MLIVGNHYLLAVDNYSLVRYYFYIFAPDGFY